MPQQIDIPGQGIVEFPDEMNDEQITQAAQRLHSQVKQPAAPVEQRGNIDISNRPVVQNPDGTVSTEKSFSINQDGREVLLPQVINAKVVDQQQAIEHYNQTGENLGVFNSIPEANAYAERLHNRFNPPEAPAPLSNVAAMKSGVAAMSPEARGAADATVNAVVKAVPDVIEGATKAQQYMLNPASVVSDALTPRPVKDFMQQQLVPTEAVDVARRAAQYPAPTLYSILTGEGLQPPQDMGAGKFASEQIAAQTTPENLALIAGTEGLGALEKGLAKTAPTVAEALFGRLGKEAGAVAATTAATEAVAKPPPVPKELGIPEDTGTFPGISKGAEDVRRTELNAQTGGAQNEIQAAVPRQDVNMGIPAGTKSPEKIRSLQEEYRQTELENGRGIPEGSIEEGLHTEYPDVAEKIDRYVMDNDVSGITDAINHPRFPEYQQDLQRLIKRSYGDQPFMVQRIEGYSGGTGEGAGDYVSVSTNPFWGQGSGKPLKTYYIKPEDVVLAGHEQEGELIVKRSALKRNLEQPVGGEPNAIEPSNAQVQGGETTPGVETRPASEVPRTSDSNNVIGETQGTEAGGQVPRQGTEAQVAPTTEAGVAPAEKPPVQTGISTERLQNLYGKDSIEITRGKGAQEWQRIGQADKRDPYAVLTEARKNGIATPEDTALLRAEHQRLNEAARAAWGTPEYEARAQAAVDLANATKQVAHGPASDIFRSIQEVDKPRYNSPADFDSIIRERMNRESTPTEKATFERAANEVRNGEQEVSRVAEDAQAELRKYKPKETISFDEAVDHVRKQIAALTKDCLI